MILQRWSKLYTHQTKAEQALEPALARLGVPYRCQHPVWKIGAILDFALPTLGVAIEVDGPSHRRPGTREKDRVRTSRLEEMGWTLVRVTNERVLKDPHAAVLFLVAQLPPKKRRELLLASRPREVGIEWGPGRNGEPDEPRDSEDPDSDPPPPSPEHARPVPPARKRGTRRSPPEDDRLN